MNQPITVTLKPLTPSNSWLNKGIAINGQDIVIYTAEAADQSLMQIQQAARNLEGLGAEKAVLAGSDWTVASQWAFALGFYSAKKLDNLTFTGDAATVKYLSDKYQVVSWSKQLIHQFPAELYPSTLVKQAHEFIASHAPEHVSVEVIAGEALQSAGWMGIYNVGKGSQHAPAMMILDYNPSGKADEPVDTVLVGKGITFDSGGYSLKSSEGMVNMKADMGGAATVTAGLALAIRQGLKKRTKLILCCAENMVSGNAYKLSDIITYKNGTTVEILNTDAEGRIVLADGLIAAGEFNPKSIIDAATLTGAAVMALGGDYTALFGLDQTAVEKAKQAAAKVNEPVWQLPLAPWHKEKCPSPFADTANSRSVKGGGPGGASNAAGFLSRFVPNEGKGWVHMDLAADYNGSANGLWAAGATGLGIATIAEMLIA